jgi:hypothetical protein
MLVKAMILFLGAIALVGMIGRLFFPQAARRIGGLRAPSRCPVCGTWQVGSGPCPCGHAPRRRS